MWEACEVKSKIRWVFVIRYSRYTVHSRLSKGGGLYIFGDMGFRIFGYTAY